MFNFIQNSALKRLIANFFLWAIGWKVIARVTPEMAHSVMLAAPHTSNWDFPLALAAFWKMGIDVKYFIKDNYTKSLVGWFFKWTGAIGVDRSKKSNNLTDHAIELLKANDQLVVLVPAEGTRKRVEQWRTGFYHISREADVPISLGYLDYVNKIAGVAQPFQPSGDFNEDMTFIQEFYRPISAKYPEQYNPQIFKPRVD